MPFQSLGYDINSVVIFYQINMPQEGHSDFLRIPTPVISSSSRYSKKTSINNGSTQTVSKLLNDVVDRSG